VREFCHELEDMGLQINDSKGSDTHILGLIGDTKAIAESWVLANPVVETCRRVSEPYKKANRKFHPDDSVIDVEGVKIGGGNFAVIAGPCSIESEEQITYCAQRVKAAGASLLRGGAFKPRTSPYSFQGMRSEGLDLLKLARRATGSPIVTEIMNTEHLPLFENVDLIQVGARNMQNFELLKAVGRQKKPVLLKRGLANTLEEFVMSAEYIMAEVTKKTKRGCKTLELKHYLDRIEYTIEGGTLRFTALLPCGSGEALNLNPSLLTDFLRTQGAAPVWQCRVVRTHLYNKAGKDFE
jgi:3-deoxy-7-phosphoheptulonate synthase